MTLAVNAALTVEEYGGEALEAGTAPTPGTALPSTNPETRGSTT